MCVRVRARLELARVTQLWEEDREQFARALAKRIDDGGRWRTALHKAAQMGRCDIIKFLITKGAVVNDRDPAGITPLWIAVHNRQEAAVKMLLSRGGDADMKCESGISPRRLAIQQNIEHWLLVDDAVTAAASAATAPTAAAVATAAATATPGVFRRPRPLRG